MRGTADDPGRRALRETWAAVDGYFGHQLAPGDPALDAALEANARAGLPAQDVSPLQGRLLEVLVAIAGAARALEIGTLGGYSTIWLARAVGPGGRVVTLEADPAHAEVARANIARAGLGDRVDLRPGRATDLLPALAAEGGAPFDFVFIDADKRSNPEYLAWALSLSRPGTVIVGDNVVRDGRVADAGCADADVRGVRRFTEMVAAEPRLRATAVQTVGAKGYDGFLLAVVT